MKGEKKKQIEPRGSVSGRSAPLGGEVLLRYSEPWWAEHWQSLKFLWPEAEATEPALWKQRGHKLAGVVGLAKWIRDNTKFAWRGWG